MSYGCAKFSKKVVHVALKGLKCNDIEILGKNFVGCLFKRNKISNEDLLRLKSPQWELSDDVLHMPIACVLVEILLFKIYITHGWFWWLPIWGEHMDFLQIFFTSEDKMLTQLPVKLLQQLNDYSDNDFISKLVDDFLASCYASLTTKSSHFVWSITLRNLDQFP